MWDTLIINPMVNALLLLYQFLGNNFILAIAVFTIIVRVITLPLNIRQQRSSLRMQEMQPQIQAIQKKFRDNPQKMQEEFQKIGYNPAETLAGCLPLLIQFPILIGLYQAIIVALGSTPQQLFELTKRVSDGIDLSLLLPIDNTFAWLNLGQPDPLFILPVLVAGTMFLQQKLLSPAAKKDDSKKKANEEPNPAAAMTQQMLYVMPVMFGFFSLSFPAGLSIYFVLANIIGIGQGYYMRYTMAQEKEAQANKPKPTKKSDPEPIVEDGPPAPIKNSKNGSANATTPVPTSKKKNQSKRKRRSAKK